MRVEPRPVASLSIESLQERNQRNNLNVYGSLAAASLAGFDRVHSGDVGFS